MKNSKFVIDKLAKLFEQGLISSKDLTNDLMTILNKIENIQFISFFTVEPSKDDIFNYLNDFEDNLLKGNRNLLSLFGPQIFHIKDDIRWERVNLFFSLDEFKDKFFNKKVYS